MRASLRPSWYSHALSRKVTPASTARCTSPTASALRLTVPRWKPPRPSALTWTPVRPNGRRGMGDSDFTCASDRMIGRGRRAAQIFTRGYGPRSESCLTPREGTKGRIGHTGAKGATLMLDRMVVVLLACTMQIAASTIVSAQRLGGAEPRAGACFYED